MKYFALKSYGVGIGAILLLWGLSSCGGNTSKDRHADTATSGVIQLTADESFRDIIQQEIDVFESIYTMAGIVPIYTNEVEAINLLLKDSVRLALSSRRLSEAEKKSLEQMKLFPKEIKIATDAIALIVNKQNPDTLITVNQLRGILTGKTTQWSQMNPQTRLGEIQLVFDNENSSTVRFAMDSICRGDTLQGNLYAQQTNQAVIDYVASAPNAIGVIGATWIGDKSDSTRLSFMDRVTVMGVTHAAKATRANSYQPYQAYIALGDYPLVRNIYALVTDPRSGLASGFVSFLASDRGQRIILRSGIVPATQNLRIVNVRDTW
ncbi:MAG: substrate-binding domain-containing protein [Alistipes sp.]|nr:substrate-binding domain-containing protein [Alistipes sp.]